VFAFLMTTFLKMQRTGKPSLRISDSKISREGKRGAALAKAARWERNFG
jgi:hypothetical protein